MKQDKKSPILKVAMFPYTVLKYAYIGVLAVLGKNKMRHVKADVKTDVAEASSEQSVVPTIATTTPKKKEKKEQDISKLESTKSVAVKESVTGNATKTYGFRYTVLLNNGKKYTNTFDAPNIQEVERFLKNEGYEIVKIVPRNKLDIDLPTKLKISTLAFDLTQISTYLKSGIALVDAIRIVSKQTQNKVEKVIWDKVTYDLLSGKNFSEALEAQGNVFPAMLINMIKTAELTGALTEILDDMADYYEQTSQTRKEMISAMIYPAIVFFIALFVTVFMFVGIVPTFGDMIKEQSGEEALPTSTQIIMGISDFMIAPTFHPDEAASKTDASADNSSSYDNLESTGTTKSSGGSLNLNLSGSKKPFRVRNYMVIFVVILLILIIYRVVYKNIKAFKRTMQMVYMKVPVLGKIIVYNEVIVFTKTFASLINHGVKIADSMEVLSKVTSNELFKELIEDTMDNIVKGKNVSDAFRGSSFFPVVAYEMLVTGENTGRLGEMMEKVSAHFTNLHKNLINQMKSLVEPAMILFIGVMVGFVIISILQPMFGLYSAYSG